MWTSNGQPEHTVGAGIPTVGGSPVTPKIQAFLSVPIFCSVALQSKRCFFRLRYARRPVAVQLPLGKATSPRREAVEERAQRFQSMIDSGEANSPAHLARLFGCSKAWVTKVLGTAVTDVE